MYGLDALSEADLHDVLAEGFDESPFGVLREVVYPSFVRKSVLARRAKRLADDPDRLRCDLVLTPCKGQRVAMPEVAVRVKKKARAVQPAEPTLFAAADGADVPTGPICEMAAAGGEATIVDPADAYYLEVKTVAQYTFTDGVPGPNRTYSSELTRGVAADLRKLLGEKAITRGGVLLVHFAASEEVVRHDQGVLLHRLLDRGVQPRPFATRVVRIGERIGNTVCGVSVVEGTGERAEAL